MPSWFQHRLGGNNIDEYAAPSGVHKPALQDELAELQAINALSDQDLDRIAGFLAVAPSGAVLRERLEDRISALWNAIDIWEHSTQTREFDEIQDSWVGLNKLANGFGVSIESVCGEEVGNEATLAVEGGKGSQWGHDVDEVHSILIDLGYRKKVQGVRIWLPDTPSTKQQLTDVDVCASIGLGAIDDPDNLMLSGVSFTSGNVWNEHVFGTTKTAQFVKLIINGTAHNSNSIRIREIELKFAAKMVGETL